MLPVKTLALVGKKGKSEPVDLAREIRQRHPTLNVRAERTLAEALGWEVAESDRTMVSTADLVVVLGGDGTLIHAARLVAGRNVPILGINLGGLGFMTDFSRTDMFQALDDVLAGRLKTDARMKLSCRLWRAGKVMVEDEVLNEVVLNKGALARIAAHEASIDGEYVTTYYSDGVVISTATGSTAYSLSAGGPIVHPGIDGVILAPICSHALTQRPLIVPADRVISIELRADVADVYLTLDGQAGHALRSGDRIEVQRSPNRVHLVRNPKLGYFGVLRQKLHWGERG
jgi:NAD+ kinase